MSEFVRIECLGREVNIEFDWVARHNPGTLLVFLHEGLGSLAMWRGFPQALCEAAGCRGLVYSRPGYGRSSALWPDRQWPLDFMHIEAREILPRVLTALAIDTAIDPPVLFGGASDGHRHEAQPLCSLPAYRSGSCRHRSHWSLSIGTTARGSMIVKGATPRLLSRGL